MPEDWSWNCLAEDHAHKDLSPSCSSHCPQPAANSSRAWRTVEETGTQAALQENMSPAIRKVIHQVTRPGPALPTKQRRWKIHVRAHHRAQGPAGIRILRADQRLSLDLRRSRRSSRPLPRAAPSLPLPAALPLAPSVRLRFRVISP